jgi:cytochrome P450
MTETTLKVISSCLFGEEEQSVGAIEKNLPFILKFLMRRILSPINYPMSLPLPSHIQYFRCSAELQKLIESIVRKKIRNPGNDLLSLLIYASDEANGTISHNQLRDHILTVYLAGHETTASSLSWAVYELAKNPQIFKKAREELASIDLSNLASYNNLPYLEAIINEALRLYSPVWILGRQAIQGDRFGDLPVKAKANIIFSPFLVHRSSDYWENPNDFNPERFLKPLQEPSAFFPFASGPRICIGKSFALLEMKVILAEIINSFLFPEPAEFPGFSYTLTLRPETEITLKPKLISPEQKNESV